MSDTKLSYIFDWLAIREEVFELAISELKNVIDLPNGLNFMIGLGEHCPLLKLPTTIFTFNNLKNDVSTPNIPDIFILSGNTYAQTDEIEVIISESSQSSVWDAKKDIAFFRGSAKKVIDPQNLQDPRLLFPV